MLDLLRVGENINIIDNIREKSVLVSKSDLLFDAFIIENNGKFLQMDIELHIFKQGLTHFIDKQHNERLLYVLEHCVFVVLLFEW